MHKKIITLFFISFLFVGYSHGQDAKVEETKKWKYGLHFDTLNDTQKAFNGLTQGVIINKVSKEHPAEKAGMQVGDILTHVGMIEIKDQAHCVEVMKTANVTSGSSTLKIIRNGVKKDVVVKFE